MKITGRLIQQTPLIHFQKEKDRKPELALRVSEVKPKLDRFIRLWYKKHNQEKQIPDDWYTESETSKQADDRSKALNYKMRIIPTNNYIAEFPNENVYFGNMGDMVVPKEQIIFKEPLRIEIVSFVEKLFTTIEECLPTFFLVTNFGTRQDKGFGCFILEMNENAANDAENNQTEKKLNKDVINDAEDRLKKWYGDIHYIKIDYSDVRSNVNEKIERKKNGKKIKVDGINYWLDEIGTIYKLIKSGINMGGDYVKSALTDFFLNREVQIVGEKRAMKEYGVAPKAKKPEDEAKKPEDETKKPEDEKGNKIGEEKSKNQAEISEENCRYIRGLLGYGDTQMWFDESFEHKVIIKVRPYEAKKNNEDKDNNDIENVDNQSSSYKRIPSPLLFKVVGKCIFILQEYMDDRIFGKIYVFKGRTEKKFKIPEEKEFDLNKFIIWLADWLRPSNGEYQRNQVTIEEIPHDFENEKCIIELIPSKGGSHS
ncbi:MAG: hypothetical protein K6E85_16980 [Lachnospiraceae bacterium]|nr:hypothetical protein [Lachnospiraceae bacterium]